MIIYYFCEYWNETYCLLVPLFIFCFILRKIAVLDDTIGLRKEVKVVTVMFLIVVILRLIFDVMDLIVFDFHIIYISPQQWSPLYIIRNFIENIIWCGIIYRSTTWVLKKYDFISRRDSRGNEIDSTAITLTTTKRRKVGYETALRSVEDSEDLSEIDEHEEAMEMKRILSNYSVFEGFMCSLQTVL